MSAIQGAPGFAFFTRDLVLHQAALRAQRRMSAALGETGLRLAEPERAATCEPFAAGCGFELAFADVVYCYGDPAPALACTAQGARGKALGIKMQASLSGEELDNRLIHELFHVITFNRAPHSRDGLFMEYSFGDERISAGTLESVCAHFNCARMIPEEESEAAAGTMVLRAAVEALAEPRRSSQEPPRGERESNDEAPGSVR